MNDFQRRYLDILQQSDYISAVKRPNENIVAIDYFAYNTRIGTAAAPVGIGATAQAIIQMQADSDFVFTFLAAGSQQLATSPINNGTAILVQMTDTGSGKKYFNQPTLLPLISGSGAFPFVLPAPRVLNPNTSLQIDVQNLTGQTQVGIYFTLHGARIFYG